jgi:nucleotide-binding universal stress UspA family protein
MAGEIILGYDGSPGAKAALPHAVAFAQAFGTTLVVAFAYGANPVGGRTGDVERATAELGTQFVDEAFAAAKQLDASLDVKTELVDGLAVEGLVALAHHLDARVLVIGGNGRGPLVSTLLGSVSYKLLHQTQVPVMVVQPPDA